MVTIYCLQSLYPVVLDTHHLLHIQLWWLLLLLCRNIYIYARFYYRCIIVMFPLAATVSIVVLYATSIYQLPTLFCFVVYVGVHRLTECIHQCYCAHTSRKIVCITRERKTRRCKSLIPRPPGIEYIKYFHSQDEPLF